MADPSPSQVQRLVSHVPTLLRLVEGRQHFQPPLFVGRESAPGHPSQRRKLSAFCSACFFTAPNPGGRTFQRLNRAEYARAVEDLLALDVDAGDWLPLDQMSANFDNVADAQTLSPMLLEAYLNAASAISRLAIGESGGSPVDQTYSNSEYVSQHPWDHVEGAPYGTRGGMVVDHVFPAPMPSMSSG